MYSAITCYEEAGTRHENYDDKLGLMSAEVTLRCAYTDRHLLVADVCGNRRAWPNGAAGATPLACTASIVPVMTSSGGTTPDAQTINLGQALVTIHYTTQITDVLSESIEPTVEFQKIDHRWFRWDAANGDELREEEAPGVLFRGMNLSRHLYDVYPPLSTDLFDLVGSTNSTPYVSALLERTFDTDTLLYGAPVISRKVDSSNQTKYDIEKKFTYNPNGWNTFFRTKTATWSNIYLVTGGIYTPYPQNDFSNILP